MITADTYVFKKSLKLQRVCLSAAFNTKTARKTDNLVYCGIKNGHGFTQFPEKCVLCLGKRNIAIKPVERFRRNVCGVETAVFA